MPPKAKLLMLSHRELRSRLGDLAWYICVLIKRLEREGLFSSSFNMRLLARFNPK